MRRRFRVSARSGPARRAFCRISDKEIRVREPIQNPDALIVQDPTLLKALDVTEGLKPDGYFHHQHCAQPLQDMHLDGIVAHLPHGHVMSVPATELALKYVGRPAPNTALLGAFATNVRVVSLDSVLEAIRRAFPGKVGEANVEAAKAAYALGDRKGAA